MPRSFFVAGITIAVSLALSGCGEATLRFVEVEGTVKLDGKPLEKIHVEFWPEVKGPQSVGLTDADGRFILATQDGTKKGVVVGKHKVVLQDISILRTDVPLGRAAEEIDLTEGRKPRIAEVYLNPTRTPLNVEIVGEKRDIEFDVQPHSGS